MPKENIRIFQHPAKAYGNPSRYSIYGERSDDYMALTKGISFRKWRNKVVKREESQKSSTLKQHGIQNSHHRARTQLSLAQLNRKTYELQLIPLYQHLDPMEAHRLVLGLHRAYHHTGLFRKEKIMEIKKLILEGRYHISARDLVEKWLG